MCTFVVLRVVKILWVVDTIKMASLSRLCARWRRHMAILCIGILLCCVLSACSADAGVFSGGEWQATGLARQPIRALVANADNPLTLYAGSDQGQVWMSADAGLHWSNYSTGLSSANTVRNLVYDNGLKQLFVVTDKGIFTRSSTSQPWRSLTQKGSGLPADSYTALDFNANIPRMLYAGTMHSGIWVSQDGGNSWSSANNGLPAGTAINDLTFDASKQQVWTATSSGVYRLDKNGQSWHLLHTGLPGGIIPLTVAPASASGGDPDLVYLGTNHGFYRSTNGGASWSANKESLAGTSINHVLVDFRTNNGSTLYIATSVGVFRSDDRGDDWSGVTTGLPRAQPVYALAFGAENYAQLYATPTTGVYQYPGTSSGLSPSRILVFVVVVLFFGLLYFLSRRRRRRTSPFPRSEAETPPDPPKNA